MPKITHFGGPFFTMVSCWILAVFGKNNVRLSAIEALTALVSSHLFVQLLKRTITRPRPYMVLSDTNTFNYLLKDYSFPSGHATASFSMAVTFSIFFPSIAFILISLAALVGISRIYMGLHYPSDVLIGSTIGMISSYATHFLSLKILL